MSAVATSQEFVSLIGIGSRMAQAGLPNDFVTRAVRAADVNDGVRELMELWGESPAAERDAICADIEDLLADMREAPAERDTPSVRPRIAFDDLDDVLSHIKAHKQKLRDLIDRHGGVSEVARKSGIPQPSLSRMLSSGSMPRRSTLYKLATALGVSETEVVGEYVR